jgi:hypothetical protein
MMITAIIVATLRSIASAAGAGCVCSQLLSLTGAPTPYIDVVDLGGAKKEQ